MADPQSRMHANSINENLSNPTVYSCNCSSANVNCIICNKSSCWSKYRRHLLTHVKSQEIPSDSVNQILFRCRKTSSDAKTKNSQPTRVGYVCNYGDGCKMHAKA